MKLSLDALKERAEATASTKLMATISGGTANECHDQPPALNDDLGGAIDAIFDKIHDWLD